MLAQLGGGVVDADALAKSALDEPEVLDTLRQWWVDAVIGPDGKVDRKAVAARIFNDDEQRERLEALIHPRVAEARKHLREHYSQLPGAGVRFIVEDCPLLLETGLDRECDLLVLVDAPREVRLQRVRENRGWDAAELSRRENRQLPLDTKLKRADIVISNAGDRSALLDQVRGLLSRVLPGYTDSTSPRH
jgi:dephospho-CoA kinase